MSGLASPTVTNFQKSGTPNVSLSPFQKILQHQAEHEVEEIVDWYETVCELLPVRMREKST